MKMEKYSHPDFKHSYLITEEVLHYGTGRRWIMQQLDEKGSIVPRDHTIGDQAEYDKLIAALNEQGWRTLLEG